MWTDEVDHLARQLLRVRATMSQEVPYSPAWAATSAWLDDLETEIRTMGIDPELLARNATWLSERRGRIRVD